MANNFRVGFRPRALRDLQKLEDYIAERSGSGVATRYIDRIEAACRQLANFPERGAARGDLRPGLRTVGFERRVTIVFAVEGTTVRIARVLYGGRDVERVLMAEFPCDDDGS